MKVLVNLSNHHIHLSRKDMEILFGPGKDLTVKGNLVQPGQFAAGETVTLAGPKGFIEGMRILGPYRKKSQCEILQSDIRRLGFTTCPVNESGKLEGSLPLTLIGPAGRIENPEGLFIARRHIHLDPKTAEENGFTDRQVVALEAGQEGRRVRYLDVVIRVHPEFLPECHLDFDEGNASGITNGTMADIIV